MAFLALNFLNVFWNLLRQILKVCLLRTLGQPGPAWASQAACGQSVTVPAFTGLRVGLAETVVNQRDVTDYDKRISRTHRRIPGALKGGTQRRNLAIVHRRKRENWWCFELNFKRGIDVYQTDKLFWLQILSYFHMQNWMSLNEILY